MGHLTAIWRFMRSRWSTSILLLAFAGCGDDLNNTPIEVCGDLSTDEFDTLQVFSMNTRMRVNVMALIADSETLPVGSEVPKQEGPGFVGVEARLDGRFVARSVRRVGDRMTTMLLEFPLSQSCLQIDCDPGDTCIDGACEPAPLPDAPPFCN